MTHRTLTEKKKGKILFAFIEHSKNILLSLTAGKAGLSLSHVFISRTASISQVPSSSCPLGGSGTHLPQPPTPCTLTSCPCSLTWVPLLTCLAGTLWAASNAFWNKTEEGVDRSMDRQVIEGQMDRKTATKGNKASLLCQILFSSGRKDTQWRTAKGQSLFLFCRFCEHHSKRWEGRTIIIKERNMLGIWITHFLKNRFQSARPEDTLLAELRATSPSHKVSLGARKVDKLLTAPSGQSRYLALRSQRCAKGSHTRSITAPRCSCRRD